MLRLVVLLTCCLALFIHLSSSSSVANWNCPVDSRYCFQSFSELATWNETRAKCARLGAEIPGKEHLNEMGQFMKLQSVASFWTSLCFNHGQLQWLGAHPYEERSITFIDKLLPDLMSPFVIGDQSYCFYSNGDFVDPLKTFGLTLKDSQHLLSGMCVANRRAIHHAPVPQQKGWIISVSVISLGADIDWGPVGQQRDGFMNIFPSKAQSLRLKCDAQTTDPGLVLNYRWLRNGAYMRNTSKEIDFSSEEDLIPWIGSLSCEAAYPNQEIVQGHSSGKEFHMVMWNTVTLRLTTSCLINRSCRLQGLIEAAKIILTQFVEIEISSGTGRDTEFYMEPPVVQRASTSIIIHMRNKRVDQFDYKMVVKFGRRFQLSTWAKNRALVLPNGSDLLVETISPCNMGLPQDRGNITWIGYLGQTVPSNNFIGGPICVDGQGEMITRSCGLPTSQLNQYQECISMKPRREEPQCINGFELMASEGKCYRTTEPTDFSSALNECWAGWQMQPSLVQQTLSGWVQDSMDWIGRTRSLAIGNGILDSEDHLIWLPLRRPNKAAPLQTPIWNWNTVSNQWIPEPVLLNVTDEVTNTDEQCAAYHVLERRLVSQSCHSHHSMICSRPALPQPISSLLVSQPDHIGQFFCPPGWVTHWLVLDSKICFRRFTLKEAVDWDDAQQECARHGAHLATAPTHLLRVALEQSYAYFNNKSTVDSWIGLVRREGDPIGSFHWASNGDGEDIKSTVYNWQPYNEFGEGYGVSTGISRMWWNWPRETKLWGIVCQKTVMDWPDALRLRLEPLSGSLARDEDYALVFSYDPRPVIRQIHDEDSQDIRQFKTIEVSQHRTYLKSLFWQGDLDVLCHFANHVRRIRLTSRQRYRTLLSVPMSMGVGPLTCEAWLNRPAYRFHSNSIIHRPTPWYSFIALVSLDRFYSLQLNSEAIVDDLMQRLSPNRNRVLRTIMNSLTVTNSIENSNNGTDLLVHYRLSFVLLSNIRLSDIASVIQRCQQEPSDVIFDPNEIATTDLESMLHLLLRSCLPLLYTRNEVFQFIDVRSTLACPALQSSTSIRPFWPNVNENDLYSTDQLAWPKTLIGQMAKPIQLCFVSSTQLVFRLCEGSFERGAIWGQLKITKDQNEISSNPTQCQLRDPDSSAAKLQNLIARMTRSNIELDDVTAVGVLTQSLAEWDQPGFLSLAEFEMTVSVLKHLMSVARKSNIRLDRTLLANILERMVRPGKSALSDLQHLPQVLDDFVQLLSDLPAAVMDFRGQRARIRLGDQVSVVAEVTDLTSSDQQPIVIDFPPSLTVTIARDFSNLVSFRSNLMAVVAVLPSELLAKETEEVELFRVNPADSSRVIEQLSGHFFIEKTTVHIDLKTIPLTETTTLPLQSSPFALAFQADSDFIPGTSVWCARWQSSLTGHNDSSRQNGGWTTGGCWYLGWDRDAHHCQCHTTGIYGLLHSPPPGMMGALPHQLPVIVAAVLLILVVVVLSCRSMSIYKKVIHEMDLVEMGSRLQLIVAWAGVVFCHLGHYFVAGIHHHTVGCLVLTTAFQFFLTCSFLWMSALVCIRYWQIHDHWFSSQKTLLVKISLTVWGLSSVVVFTIPIYKWQFLMPALTAGPQCWLEDPVDFGLTVAIVGVASCFCLILHIKNGCYQIGERGLNHLGDSLSIFNTILMTIGGLAAVFSNSWYHTFETAVLFGCASVLLGLLWVYTFWMLVPSPLMTKHTFDPRRVTQVVQPKKNDIFVSSIEFLSTDRTSL